MIKALALSLAAATAVLATGVAQAGVAWSVNIGVPGVETVVSNGPVYRPVPRVYQVPPVVYAPAPVYAPVPVYAPQPIVEYAPVPVEYDSPGRFYRPAPVVVFPPYGHGHRGGDRRHDWHGDHDRDGRWDGHR